MYAMQYQITLPTDYDMQIIRNRVAETGHLMDGFSGLQFKAYLIQERSNGAPCNSYAPFYVWHNIDGMRKFCWSDPGYSAIVRDFGRHPIQDWLIHKFFSGPSEASLARSLNIKTLQLPRAVAPSSCIEDLTQDFLRSTNESTVALLTAVDLGSWTLLFAELSTKESEQENSEFTSFEVLHVSESA